MLIGSLQLPDVTNKFIYRSTNFDGNNATQIEEINSVKVVSDVLVPEYVRELWISVKEKRDLADEASKGTIEDFLQAMISAVEAPGATTDDPELDVSKISVDSVKANLAVDKIFKAITPIFQLVRNTPGGAGMTQNLRRLFDAWNFKTYVIFPKNRQDVSMNLANSATGLSQNLKGIGMRASVEKGEMKYSLVKDAKIAETPFKSFDEAANGLADLALQEGFEAPRWQYRIHKGNVWVETLPQLETGEDNEFKKRQFIKFTGIWRDQHLEDIIQVCNLIQSLPSPTEDELEVPTGDETATVEPPIGQPPTPQLPAGASTRRPSPRTSPLTLIRERIGRGEEKGVPIGPASPGDVTDGEDVTTPVPNGEARSPLYNSRVARAGAANSASLKARTAAATKENKAPNS